MELSRYFLACSCTCVHVAPPTPSPPHNPPPGQKGEKGEPGKGGKSLMCSILSSTQTTIE